MYDKVSLVLVIICYQYYFVGMLMTGHLALHTLHGTASVDEGGFAHM